MTYLFISHNIAVTHFMSRRIGVMYLRRLVEIGPSEKIVNDPRHPYTQSLISAIPESRPTKEKKVRLLSGDVPSPTNPPAGCRFHTRCPFAVDHCLKEEPHLEAMARGHLAACHRKRDMEKLVAEKFGN